MLIIPKKHAENLFELTQEELSVLFEIIKEAKEYLEKEYKPDGFNIGVNQGEAGGQTIFHLHIHIIPRYKGDMEEPEGGVRGVIPEKRKYRTSNTI